MLAFLYLILLPFTAPQTIHGQIMDQRGNPLHGVRIKMNHSKAFSDTEGHFTINNASVLSTISFSAIGYTTTVQAVKAHQNEMKVIMKEQIPEIRQQP
ncbi:hypothetical protein EWU23_07570 [Cytophagaceae bacterium 50C-KIRBA]|uniref:Carboxypeptidase-like regulatory domain-containing protein n=1 Tax=Aquirufa beregesia TaxID=2516556 RepID=A0ABX0EWP5_9BACT|nr:carboxypeptidase-like regulatory domain-containing protein [Aquirufa beregesia]NGZ44330.1 hypothetical protein [Aquirufa beregesia]